eukprot:CAMPEP_0116877290 /NCGR_PEP_ID=MMETSP0463-20121206/9080_1 /TAXON_ID=181622 /ORGANISM="Strombidinopsis sp, Strain SopsisLIS2011" /LENGTH=133 /DNA_ID=CAMNT_0004524443 /DNA_START=33 /DNA_END=434 /DNA_ORIENTATION=+
MSTKEDVTKVLEKQMEEFAKLPEETKAKMMEQQKETMSSPEKLAELEQQNLDVFAQADKDNDGVLNQEEYREWGLIWHKKAEEKHGQSFPFQEELNKLAWENYQVSGKGGVTLEDMATVKEWTLEYYAKLHQQ